ncbi:MAG: hypothetical protein OEV44_04385, partial [Spirochaetota bacterium]|nr:hypothetical protein [Spirochaetota bacterium]
MKRFVNLSFKMIVSLVTVMIIVASWFTWRMLVLQEENFNDGLKSARILLETLKDSETQGPKLLTEINIVQGTDVSVTKLVDSAKSIKNNIPQLIDVKIISAGDKKLLASWDNSNVWPTNILNTLGKIDNKYFHKQVEKDNIGRFFHSPENELLIYYTPLQRVGDSDPQGYMYMEYSLQSLYKASYQSIMILIRSIGVMIIV